MQAIFLLRLYSGEPLVSCSGLYQVTCFTATCIKPPVSYSGSLLYNLNKYIANILKASVKDENNSIKDATTFSKHIINVPIEDDEIMTSFDVTSLYTNIPIIDSLNIIKDYVNNDD